MGTRWLAWTALAAGATAGGGCLQYDARTIGSARAPALRFETGTWEVAPGEDGRWCMTVDVPGEPGTVYDVSRMRITAADGSHHAFLHRAEQDVEDGFGECEIAHPAFIGGSPAPGSSDVEFPAGKAVPLFAGEQLVLESHYVNATGVPILASVVVELFTVPHEEVVDYLQTVLKSYEGFVIPPGETWTGGETIQELPGIQTWQITSHMHKRGTLFTVDRTVDHAVQRIYESRDWASPAVVTYDPPLDGSFDNSLTWNCTWTNETDEPITFGTTAEDEMCLLVLTFFPSWEFVP